MKLILMLGLVAAVLARPDDVYDPKYDNFNVDEIIENARLLKSYALCFLGEGRCTPEGTTFTKWIPEAVETDCQKCTEKQKVLIAKVIKAMMETVPEHWEKLREKHDPGNKREKELKEYIAKYTA